MKKKGVMGMKKQWFRRSKGFSMGDLLGGLEVKYTEVKWGKDPWDKKCLSIRRHKTRTGRSGQVSFEAQVGRKGRYGFHPSSKGRDAR